jgi:hypothetical protein
MAPDRVRRGSGAVIVLVAVSLLAFGCASSARPPVPVSLPVPRSGQITFYLSLPSSTSALSEAVDRVAAPGSSQYRHFTSPDQAARQFGASDAQITAVARAISRLACGSRLTPPGCSGG